MKKMILTLIFVIGGATAKAQNLGDTTYIRFNTGKEWLDFLQGKEIFDVGAVDSVITNFFRDREKTIVYADPQQEGPPYLMYIYPYENHEEKYFKWIKTDLYEEWKKSIDGGENIRGLKFEE
jgi:hypothetical protein